MAIITDRTMNKKPTGQEEWIIEDAPKGSGRFCLRISEFGEKFFYFRYTAPGRKQIRHPIGPYDPSGASGLTLKQARRKADDLSRLYQSGIKDLKGYLEEQLAAEKARLEAERLAAERAAKRLTVLGLFEKWHSAQLCRRKDGGAKVKQQFEKDVFPAIGSMYADEVKKGHIAEIVDNILGRGCNRLAKMVFSDLRQMFKWSIYRDWLEVDPTAGIRKMDIGTKDTERDRVLSEDEIKLLAKLAPEANLMPTTEAAVWICLATGCRIGELLTARWEHIDFDKRVWLLPETKNSKSHEIHISNFALPHFGAIRRFNGCYEWLFPNRGKNDHVSTKTITKQVTDRQRETAMSNRSQKTGVLALPGGKWVPHDLRRTAATQLAMLGVSPEIIERVLNHTEQNKVQRVYQRYSYQPEMQKAWELLGERLEALTTGQPAAKVLPLRKSG